jgi:hypothetical protein
MKDKRTWQILQDLEDAFDKVITIEFLVERLQLALEKNNMSDNMSDIIDITHALNAFLPVFIQNYDENLKKTWNHVVKRDYECVVKKQKNTIGIDSYVEYEDILKYEEFKKNGGKIETGNVDITQG